MNEDISNADYIFCYSCKCLLLRCRPPCKEGRIGRPAAPSWRWPTGRRRSGEPALVPDISVQRCTWGGAGRPGGCRRCRGSSSSPAPGLSSDPGTRSWGILENIRSGNLWFGNIWLGNIWLGIIWLWNLWLVIFDFGIFDSGIFDWVIFDWKLFD